MSLYLPLEELKRIKPLNMFKEEYQPFSDK